MIIETDMYYVDVRDDSAAETYRLALESIVRWADRATAPGPLRLDAIHLVARTALNS